MEGATSQNLYFKYGIRGDEMGNIWIYTGESGEEEVMGIMGCITFREEEGRIVGQLNTMDYEAAEPSPSETSFINPQALIRSIEDQGDTIKVTAPLSEEELESGPADVYILDRKTLQLLEYSYINEDGEPLITGEFQYGADDKGMTDRYISAWDKTRRIKFNYEKITGSGETEHESLSVLVPATWEVVPVYEEETFLYMDRELTKPYEYPGDGKEYTIYVTNAAG